MCTYTQKIKNEKQKIKCKKKYILSKNKHSKDISMDFLGLGLLKSQNKNKMNKQTVNIHSYVYVFSSKDMKWKFIIYNTYIHMYIHNVVFGWSNDIKWKRFQNINTFLLCYMSD